MGFLLQMTMSCPRALSRQVAGAGCELAVHAVETGCWCWCRVPVLGAGAVSSALKYINVLSAEVFATSRTQVHENMA